MNSIFEKFENIAVATTVKRPEILPESVLKAVWTNIFDEEFRMKEEYVKGLARLSWVKGFDIGPMSEDKHGQTDGRKASISGLLADSTGKYYAATCYPSCLKGISQGVWAEEHERLKHKEEYKNGSKACAGSTYEFTDGDKRQRLGTFHRGLYDDKHDIALIEIDPDLNCQDIFFEEKGIEKTLASKKEVIEKFKEMNGSVPVGKISRFGTADTKGELFAIGCSFDKVINYNSYRIRAPDGKVFAKRGDAGSLVYMICNGRKIPFAYLTNMHRGFYYCCNLKSSLEALNISIEPCLVDGGISNRWIMSWERTLYFEGKKCERNTCTLSGISMRRRLYADAFLPAKNTEAACIKNDEGSKNEWFEENVLDENYDTKEVYVNKLISGRFSWIKEFYIGSDREKKSWQMYITYARNTEPCMQNLKNLFGDNIASFVKFTPESDANDEKLRFLQAPGSGDLLKERGIIGVAAAQYSKTEPPHSYAKF